MELFPVLNEFDTFNMASLRIEIIHNNLGNQAEKILEQDFQAQGTQRSRLQRARIRRGRLQRARLKNSKSSENKIFQEERL